MPGQKWHLRQYQNEDGSLTPLGRQHYGVGEPRSDGQDNTASATAAKMGAKTDGKSSSPKVVGTRSASAAAETKTSHIDGAKVKKGLKIAAKVGAVAAASLATAAAVKFGMDTARSVFNALDQ